MHHASLEKKWGEGANPQNHPTQNAVDSRSTKSWYPRLSVDTSLPTHIFRKHSTFLGVGAHMVWGREAGGLMWIVEYLTKNNAAGPVIYHQISVLWYCINVSLRERTTHPSFRKWIRHLQSIPTVYTHIDGHTGYILNSYILSCPIQQIGTMNNRKLQTKTERWKHKLFNVPRSPSATNVVTCQK